MRKDVPVDPRLIQLEKAGCECSIKSFKRDIIEYLQQLEAFNSKVNPAMIDNQPEINWMMRPYIIDFLVELHRFFKLGQETLHLACFIADKYCSKRIVYKRHYQLLIATSLWIAAKFKDKKSRVPTLKELNLLCHQTYDSKIFLEMEKHILTTLDWSISNLVSTFDMFQLIVSTSTEELIPKKSQLINLSLFFCDLTLYQRNYLCYSSSTKAISALLLASRILCQDNFPSFLSRLINISPETGELYFGDPNFDTGHYDSFYDANDAYDSDTKTNDIDPVDDLTSIICKQSIDDIRNCFYLFLKDIFDENLDSRESISAILLKKHKILQIKELLDYYRMENFDLFNHLSSLRHCLKKSQMNSHSDLFDEQLKDSIICSIDKFAGLKTDDGKFSGEEFPLTEDNLLFSSLAASPMTDDLTVPKGAHTLNQNALGMRVMSNPIFNMPFSSQSSSSQVNAYPPTPHSTNSCFSGRPRLSFSSSSSSISYSTNSMTSPAGLLKKSLRSSSRYSPPHIHPYLSRKSSFYSDCF